MLNRKLLRTLLAGAALFAVLAFAACDPGKYFTVENRSDQPVLAYLHGDQFRDPVPAGKTSRWVILRFEDKQTFEVKALDGTVLATRTASWKEMMAEGGLRFTIQ